MNRGAVTRALIDAGQGDRAALDAILPLVYDELRRLAQSHMQAERSDHTLSATALLHEAYLKLVDQNRVQWQGRGHFFGVASMAMRRLLVSHARGRGREKRGGDMQKLHLDHGLDVVDPGSEVDLVALDQLLDRFAEFDPRAARVIECRVFGGLTIEETAQALDLSPMTVKRAWTAGKTWLRRELSQGN